MGPNFMTQGSFICDLYSKRTKVSSLVLPTDAIPAAVPVLFCPVHCVSCDPVAQITCEHSCWNELEMCRSCKKERVILSEESSLAWKSVKCVIKKNPKNNKPTKTTNSLPQNIA